MLAIQLVRLPPKNKAFDRQRSPPMLQTLADRAKAHLSDYAITPYHTDGAPYLHNVEIDGLTFDAAFDSGNATRVEKVPDTENEYAIWTRRDAEGTPGENGCRTWFYFSVRGATPGQTYAFRIHNMNSQGNLFRHDMRPVVRSLPSSPEWERLATAPSHWGGKNSDKYREMRENLKEATGAEGEFVLRFEHTVPAEDLRPTHNETLYFAFCFPMSYTDTMARLAWLDQLFALPVAHVNPPTDAQAAAEKKSSTPTGGGGRKAATNNVDTSNSSAAASALKAALSAASLHPSAAPSRTDVELANAAVSFASKAEPYPAQSGILPDRKSIYYHRELLTRSLDGRRVDLITISSTDRMLSSREPPLLELTEHPELPSCGSEGGQRARLFSDTKPVFLLTSRVHPGETPASHVWEGMLQFLLHPTDPRAIALRERFVFKLIPIINPDGVYRGNYRSDSKGVNLNRVYADPSPTLHPTVFAITSLVKQLHGFGSLMFYIDCHAHSNKRGCFLFGNAISAEPTRLTDSVLFAKIAEQNCRWFDFEGCVFSEANMSRKDSRDITVGKEGSGRVGVYRLTGLTYVYTLECNYNMGRKVNRLMHPHVPQSMLDMNDGLKYRSLRRSRR